MGYRAEDAIIRNKRVALMKKASVLIKDNDVVMVFHTCPADRLDDLDRFWFGRTKPVLNVRRAPETM